MEINYVESKDGTKLFSFNRHDYKTYTDKDGNFMMIDGGFEYTRFSVDHINSFLKKDEIENLISDIRNEFEWGQNYDKDNNRLVLSKEETKEWLNSTEGKEFKKNNPIDYVKYKNGEELIPAPTKFVLLKDLNYNHIVKILIYFTEILTENEKIRNDLKIKYLIFLHELNYRNINNITL